MKLLRFYEVWQVALLVDLVFIVEHTAAIGDGFDESIDSCVSDSECHQRNVVCYRHFADCQRGMCMCRQPYSFRFVGRDMICVQSVPLESRCDSESDLCYPHAECRRGACQCRPGFLPDSDRRGCHATDLRHIGESCRDSNQCIVIRLPTHGSVVECDRDVCSCRHGSKQDGDSCRLFRYRDFCSRDESCGSDMVCSTGECRCARGMTFSARSAAGQLSGACQPINPIPYLREQEHCTPGSQREACSPGLQCGRCPEWSPSETYKCLVRTPSASLATQSESGAVKNNLHLVAIGAVLASIACSR